MAKKRRGEQGDGSSPGFSVSWWVAAVVMGMVAVMVVGVLVGRALGGGEDGTAADESASPSSAVKARSEASGGQASARASGCPKQGAGDGEASDVVAAPPTTWEAYGGGTFLLPKTAAGPSVRGEVARRCYARSPLGALTAGVNTLMGVSTHGKTQQWMAASMITPGPARSELQADPKNDAPTPRVRAARLLSYSPHRAQLEVVVEMSDQRRQVLVKQPATAVWLNGDWKLDGADDRPPVIVQSLDGLIRWEAGQ